MKPRSKISGGYRKVEMNYEDDEKEEEKKDEPKKEKVKLTAGE